MMGMSRACFILPCPVEGVANEFYDSRETLEKAVGGLA